METEDRTVLTARVTGRVQGVSFRDWTRAEATGLGLTGWVRNRDDGSVEALLAGPSDRVADMVRRLHEGPAAARVTDVATAPSGSPAPEGFTIAG